MAKLNKELQENLKEINKITFQWKDDFEGFLAYIGKAPNDGQLWSVERIDVNGNYEEGNIRWQPLLSKTKINVNKVTTPVEKLV